MSLNSNRPKKTRYVRIQLDYVIDMGREVEVLPHEVMGWLERRGGAGRVDGLADAATVELVVRGLKAVLPKKNRVALLSPVHRSVSLWFPDDKKSEDDETPSKPPLKKTTPRKTPARRRSA